MRSAVSRLSQKIADGTREWAIGVGLTDDDRGPYVRLAGLRSAVTLFEEEIVEAFGEEIAMKLGHLATRLLGLSFTREPIYPAFDEMSSALGAIHGRRTVILGRLDALINAGDFLAVFDLPAAA